MKKVGIILLVIVFLVVLGVRVVNEEKHEKPNVDSLSLRIIAKIYEKDNATSELDYHSVNFDLDGSSELQFENVTAMIRSKNDGYELSYSGQLKGFGKTIVTKGIYFFGFFFGEQYTQSLYTYLPVYGTISFVKPDKPLNDGLPQPAWYIEENKPIDLSKFNQ